jgi:hypothetical protein
MKFKQLLEGLLLEANTKDVLMTKAGLNERNADLLVTTFGKLAIKIFNKVLEGSIKINTERPEIYAMSGVGNYDGATLKDKIIEYFNDSRTRIQDYFGGRNEMNSVRDYIRIALNNNYTQIQDLSIMEMVEKAKEWHDEMGGGTSDFNYEEENEVVLDFRENGAGYYWAYLGARDCPKEAKRMGHCASSGGYLYSLRENKKIDENHTLNRSALTASIDSDDKLIQLKGKANSKPKDEYLPYIFKFLFLKKEDGGYLINGFGCEYKCENDFHLSDLSEEDVKHLYESRPELFNGRKEKRLLRDLGLAVINKDDGKFTYHIDSGDIIDFLEGGKDYRNDLIPSILTGDTWDVWGHNHDGDWKYAIENEINQRNLEKIKLLIQNEINDEYESLEDTLEDLDTDTSDEIIRSIKNAIDSAEGDDYVNYLYKTLVSSLSEYGNLLQLNDDGATIEINLYDLTSGMDEYYVDQALDDCDEDLACAFYELVRNGSIDKPKFYLDDRWYPSMDKDNFNSILSDYLNEI